MQMRIRRACPHDLSAGRLMHARQSRGLRIKRPHDHPVRPHGDRWAHLVIRVGIAPLRCTSKHVCDRGTVLVGLGSRALKSTAHCIEAASAHIGGRQLPLGHTNKTAATLAQVSTIFADSATSSGQADSIAKSWTLRDTYLQTCTRNAKGWSSAPSQRFAIIARFGEKSISLGRHR